MYDKVIKVFSLIKYFIVFVGKLIGCYVENICISYIKFVVFVCLVVG